MKSRSSAKSTIASKRRSTSLRVRPSITPLIATFSRPEISGWNPAPSSMRAETRPSTARLPREGFVMPATSLSSVDLPEPFSPMTPKADPFGTSNETPSSAVKVSSGPQVREHAPGQERALERLELVAVGEAPVALRDVPRDDGGVRHTSSGSVSRRRSNRKAPAAKARIPTRSARNSPRQWSTLPWKSICW